MAQRPIWFATRPGRNAVAPATREGWIVAAKFAACMALSGLIGGAFMVSGVWYGWPMIAFGGIVMALGMFASGYWFIVTAMNHSDNPRWNGN